MEGATKEMNVLESDGNVCKLGAKMPPFWAQEPALWFAQIEGQFIISGITADTTKFYHVIAQLDHQYAAEVKDIIINPPREGKYEKLKAELIKRLSESQEKRVKQLLVHEELGDRKPSQFLRHLQTLAGQNITENFLRTLWASRLPHNIQTVIASQSTATLESVAELADRVHEIAPTTSTVASVRADSSTDEVISKVSRQLEELTRQVASLQSQVNRSRSRNRFNYDATQYRNRSSSRSKSKQRNDNYCWYHNRFAHKAQKCIAPCSYPASAPLNGNNSRN